MRNINTYLMMQLSKAAYAVLRRHANVLSQYDIPMDAYVEFLKAYKIFALEDIYGFEGLDNYYNGPNVKYLHILWEAAGRKNTTKYRYLLQWYIREAFIRCDDMDNPNWRWVDEIGIDKVLAYCKRLDTIATLGLVQYFEAVDDLGIRSGKLYEFYRIATPIFNILGRVNLFTRFKIVYAINSLENHMGYISMRHIRWEELRLIKKFEFARRLVARAAWKLIYPDIVRQYPMVLGESRNLPHPILLGKGLIPFMQLLEKYNPEKSWLKFQAAYNIAILFNKKAEEWISRHGGNIVKSADFTLPTGSDWVPSLWTDFFLKYPQAIKFAYRLHRFNYSELKKAPKTLSEFKRIAAKYFYDNIKNYDVAYLSLCYGLDQEQFEVYQRLARRMKKHSLLPDVVIQGSEVGLNNNWVWRKLPDGDPRGLFLGYITNCCQHLEGVAKECVIAGWTRPESGFYVVEYKGKIVAQSWAWLSEDNVLVFDNVEALGGKETPYIAQIALLYKYAAEKIVQNEKYGVRKVTLGAKNGVSMPLANELQLSLCEDAAQMPFVVNYTDATIQFTLYGGVK